MKKIVTKMLLVLAMLGFIALAGAPAFAATAPVYCNSAYSNWIGSPGSQRTMCPAVCINPGNYIRH